MHTAIECTCGTIIVYDVRNMTMRCPKCNGRWMQAPELFSDDGVAAERLPYLCAEYANNPIDDVMHGAIATSILRGIEKHNRDIMPCDTLEPYHPKTLPETFTVIDHEGRSAEVPTSLKDFATESAYRLTAASATPPRSDN